MKIWIKKDLLDEIFSDGNKWLPKETGGILMGYRVADTYVITQLVGAGENAIHGSNTFKPDQEFHKTEIARIYKESEQKITYLGDWHTHPDSYPYLSSTDRSTGHKISKFKKARLPNPLMLVAAPPKIDFKIWAYDRSYEDKMGNFAEGDVVVF